MATLKDIAKKVGVSVTAVSLVLGDKPNRISEKIKEEIMKTAEELQYRPNKLAVGLITNKTSTIGIVVPDIRNIFYAELCKGCEDACKEAGYSLLLSISGEDDSNDLNYINLMIDNRVDGLIYAQSSSNDALITEKISNLVKETNKPFVTVDRELPHPNGVKVLFNNEQSGYLATKHLLLLGHTKIACLTGPNNNVVSRERLLGYKRALAEFDVPFDRTFIIQKNFSFAAGLESLAQIRGLGVSAVFCFNDMMALGVYKAMKYYNLSVPKDLSVIGHDNIFVADFMDTPLTTIHQPAYEMGKTAVVTLLKLINGKKTDKKLMFEPSLVMRSSTGEYEG